MSNLKLEYRDDTHSYWLGGYRAKSVTAVAKIATDTWGLDQWKLRQVAVGLTMDRRFGTGHLIENIACDLEDRTKIQEACDAAMNLADTKKAADRGTQMHRVLELVLLDQTHRLLTEQQERDAVLLRRTLDRYGLTPCDGLCEQFVAWPTYRVTGRFDAVMERPDGSVILVDLKSGTRAIEYPQSVAVQLALYARSHHVSAVIEDIADKVTVTEWRCMPRALDLDRGYVLLVEPNAEVGTLHEVDIAHGWEAAQACLELVKWRKKKDFVREIPPWREGIDDVGAFAKMAVANASTVDELRELWRINAESGELTEGLKGLINQRVAALQAAS